jgi:serine protease Do
MSVFIAVLRIHSMTSRLVNVDYCRALAACAFCLFAIAPLRAEEPPATDPDPDIEFASRIERAYKKLAKRVAPCVVSLQVNVKPGIGLEEWRRLSDHPGMMPPEQFEGSGVIVDPSGLIITNEHVLRGADQIRVRTNDGTIYFAQVCGTDPRSDVAMIKLVGENLPEKFPFAEFADSDKVEIGQFALAIGNPLGLTSTFTTGVVSNNNRSMQLKGASADVFYGKLIQTDAAINPGNSGGPLFDLRGKVMGVNTMIFSKTGLSMGFGFAIPANHLKKRMALLRDGQEVQYGWLGLALADLRAGQKLFKVPDDKGVLVSEVIPNTPADRAGFQQGMVILEYENARITSTTELIAAVNETPVGQFVTLKVLDRNEKIREIKARISKRYSELVRATEMGARDDDEQESPLADIEPGDEKKPSDVKSEGPFKNTLQWRGMQLKELPADAMVKRGGSIEVVRVRKGTPADRAGLYEGAIITEIKIPGNPSIQKINSLDELKRLTANLTGPAAVFVRLDGYLTIEEK